MNGQWPLMNEQSPLPYRLAMYASFAGGSLLSLYGNWAPGAILLLVAMIMQWRRILPPKFERSRWMGVICAALMIAIDIYGMIDPQVEPFLGQKAGSGVEQFPPSSAK
jgi:hypothetical protein